MTSNPFYKLAPFIQEYIYTHGWTELRAVQVEASRVIFNTNDHLLLATGTASGKTEAAFLPVLTLLHQNPAQTLGVLYIGPTKALINDQFYRLTDLLQQAEIPAWHWHGDVSRGHKSKLLQQPEGVLQITPESLESLFINKAADLVSLFGDLRFVIIDEVHIFMNSDRGRQILCQLQRLERFMQNSPRRIGLSATLGEPAIAAEWLASGTNRPVSTPKIETTQRVRLALEHFFTPATKKKRGKRGAGTQGGGDAATVGASPLGQNEELLSLAPEKVSPYYRFIFDSSRGREKCLIFANNRAETESVIANMRQIAQGENQPDIYHVHHGSISTPLREAAERAMRDSEAPAVIAATVTLELGIDIGQLERIVQLGAPFSVSSFLQRLGRSGRRGNSAEMWFVCNEGYLASKSSLPEFIPWSLLQSIAIIQLYIEEKWIEPIHAVKYPFSLLYHQTMSTLASMGELSPPALAQRVLTLPPFRHITSDDYRTLLRHLISVDHIQQTPKGRLIVGLAGERVVRNFRFYAVFRDNQEYTVKHKSKEIGTIVQPPPEGERFALAGSTWEVEEISLKRKTVFVKPVQGKASASWRGSASAIHSKILTRMRQVLLEDTEYSYLLPHAKERLHKARRLAKHLDIDKTHILSLGGNSYCIFPWMGTIAYRTLNRYLHRFGKDRLEMTSIGGLTPYYLTLRQKKGDIQDLHNFFRKIRKVDLTEQMLVDPKEEPELEKYDPLIPAALRRKAFAADYLDVAEVRQVVAMWQ
ncbi:MAG: DEAD/DEAH box helicase [Ardenticatenaceae bacterium]